MSSLENVPIAETSSLFVKTKELFDGSKPDVPVKEDVEANTTERRTISHAVFAFSSNESIGKQQQKTDRISRRSILKSPNRRTITKSISESAHTVPFDKWQRKKYDHKIEVENRTPGFVIHPYSGFRFMWDLISCIVIVINVISIPVDVALIDNEHNISYSLLKLFSDSWFLTDIILNFRTGILINDRSEVIFDLNLIQKRYLKTWFLVDMLTSFPFDFLVSLGVSINESFQVVHLLKIGKILSLIRIARISRLVRSLHQWEEVFNLQYDVTVSVLRLFNILMILFFLCHFNACLLYFIPKAYNFPDDSWVVLRGLDPKNTTVGEMYQWALFRSTSIMLSIGWGQIIPRNLPDLWASMWCQVSGHFLFVFYIAHAIIFMQELDVSQNAYKQKLSEVHHFLYFNRIPVALQRRVRMYFDTFYVGVLLQEESILKALSPVVRAEVIWYNTASLIQSVPLFYDTSDEFVLKLGLKLQFSIFMPMDTISVAGRHSKGMHFISQGLVKIKPAFDQTLCRFLSDGTYFGEYSLLEANSFRTVTAQAVTIVHAYFLRRKDFYRVLKKCPKDKDKIKSKLSNDKTSIQQFERFMLQEMYNVLSPYDSEEDSSDDDVQFDISFKERSFH